MTLIIGIKCSDGIVIGADSAATLGAMGQSTVRQSVKKLTIIDGQLVVGVSGPVGLGQRIIGVIAELWGAKAFTDKNHGKAHKPHIAMTLVRQEILKHIEIEMQAAQVAGPVIGQAAVSSAVSMSLLAMPLGGELCLFQFDPQGAPEMATTHLPFVAIGSGQKVADPFLGFIRRVFWADRQPTLADGTFAAYWTLDYAIQGDPGGVSAPIQLITLSRQGSGWKAVELEHLEEHRQSVEAAETALRGFREDMSQTDATPPPSPPAG